MSKKQKKHEEKEKQEGTCQHEQKTQKEQSH
jgi:hypothetical protein